MPDDVHPPENESKASDEKKSWTEKLAGTLDDWCRAQDLKWQRFDGNALSHRFHVKRENIEAFLWPSLIAAALWTGMPTLSLWQLWGILVGIVCFALLVHLNTRCRTATQDLWVQVLLLACIGGGVWVFGSNQAGTGSLVYRHLLIPVVWIVGASLLIAALMVKQLFAPLLEGALYHEYVTKTELFQSRGTTPKMATSPLLSLVFLVFSVLLQPLHLLWPVAIAILVARPAYVIPQAILTFGFMALILLVAATDDRLGNSVRLIMRRFFRKAALLVSVLIMGLAAARLLGSTYVTTVFDTASGPEILIYFLFAYAIAWWYDYWTERLLGQQLFRLIVPGAASECSAKYIYEAPKATSVPTEGRTIALHGLGRILVYCGNPKKPWLPYYQAWFFEDFFTILSSSGAPGNKAIPMADQIKQRLAGFLGTTAIVTMALLAGGAWLLHEHGKEDELVASTNQSTHLPLSLLLNASSHDATHPVLLIAASGGGTRAAVFTAAVLEGLSQRQSGSRGDDIRVGSGVSGGAAAVAYFAANRPSLAASASGAWDRYFDAMSMPYIQDVIERAPEWRMAWRGRLGVLLAESFERRWKIDPLRDRLANLNDFGLICNATLAGRFERDWLSEKENEGLDLDKASAEYHSRTRSDVSGGRLIMTNLDLDRAFGAQDLPFVHGHLPILVNDKMIRVERMAAVSANFPPVFSDAAVDVDDQRRYWVTDGGAADNRGLEPVLYALRDAVLHPPPGVTRLPSVAVVTVEASGIDESFEQDRGIGSAVGAGAHFADQLNTEIANSLIAIYREANQSNDLQFYYVPMPKMLRKSGSFGTHWMLQNRISVNNGVQHQTFDGTDVVKALRAAYGCQPAAKDAAVLADWIRASDEFNEWRNDTRAMDGNRAPVPCSSAPLVAGNFISK